MFFQFAHAQESESLYRIKAAAHYGFIIAHTTGMANLIKSHVPAFEVNFELPTTGKKEWERIYSNPTWGFSWYFTDFENPEETGVATGIYPFMNFPIIKKEKFILQYRLGWGLGYVSKRFDRIKNHKNIVIGSHINAIIGMHLEAEARLSERLFAHAGIALTHFSNGAYKMPNLGFNIATSGAGFSYQIGSSEKSDQAGERPVYKKSKYLNLVGAGGIKEIYPSGGRKYGACSFSLEGVKTLSEKSHLAGSLDMFYNSSLVARLSTDSTSVSHLAVTQLGFSISYRAVISRIRVIVSNGIYIYSLYSKDGNLYHRIGMRYAINDRISANISLKTHFFRADYIETGLCYTLIK